MVLVNVTNINNVCGLKISSTFYINAKKILSAYITVTSIAVIRILFFTRVFYKLNVIDFERLFNNVLYFYKNLNTFRNRVLINPLTENIISDKKKIEKKLF